MPSRLGWQNTNIDVGPSHVPVEQVSDVAPGGPASQCTHHEQMPAAFAGPCVESSGSGLKPRATSALPGKIEPGREAPRLIKPRKRESHNENL